MFSGEYCKIFKNTDFQEHWRTARNGLKMKVLQRLLANLGEFKFMTLVKKWQFVKMDNGMGFTVFQTDSERKIKDKILLLPQLK